jgi:hypothetical protein
MRQIVRSSTELSVYEPDSAPERWNEMYGRFRAVLDSEVLTG